MGNGVRPRSCQVRIWAHAVLEVPLADPLDQSGRLRGCQRLQRRHPSQLGVGPAHQGPRSPPRGPWPGRYGAGSEAPPLRGPSAFRSAASTCRRRAESVFMDAQKKRWWFRPRSFAWYIAVSAFFINVSASWPSAGKIAMPALGRGRDPAILQGHRPGKIAENPPHGLPRRLRLVHAPQQDDELVAAQPRDGRRRVGPLEAADHVAGSHVAAEHFGYLSQQLVADRVSQRGR